MFDLKNFPVCECKGCKIGESTQMPINEYMELDKIRENKDYYIVWKNHLNKDLIISDTENLYLVQENANANT